jgi:alpha-galactosidase
MRVTFAAFVGTALFGTVAAYDNGAPNSKLPVLGWSSWVALAPGAEHPIFDYCDEESVMNAIDAFVEVGFYDAGYRHFHLDDCWASKERTADGKLQPEADHFPNGMKKLVDYAHSKGLDFGLYTCGGTRTCVGGRAGSKDHWTDDANLWASWGVDWVKMDWCNSQGEDIKTTYSKMSKAFNTSGRHIHFNMCEWGLENPWEWGDQIAQSWRMGGDHTGIWSSTKSVIQHTAAIPAKYTGVPYGWNDMDMLETGNYDQAAHANNKESNMTATEYKTEFSMWAIAASPLTVTTPIMNCSQGSNKNIRTAGLRLKPTADVREEGAMCNVSLIKQTSQAHCVLDQSFGCNETEKSMWTSNGCRGEFLCDGYSTKCDVDGDGTHSCICGPPPPVKCVPWITDLQQEILFNKEILMINQQETPQGRPINQELTVWYRNMSNNAVAVAFYNQQDTSVDISVNFTDIGLSASTVMKVRDLWQHEDLGEFTGYFPKTPDTVAPHATYVYKFSPP